MTLFLNMNCPLNGIKILDLSRLLPGPYCSMILADLGAEVIQIEDPNFILGDIPPFYYNGKKKLSVFRSLLCKNKKSMALNLKLHESLEVFYKLVSQADVILESFRPGVTQKLQIDYETLNDLNPHIIYASLTGYGQTGPYHKMPGHDINYLSISGNLEQKVVPQLQYADISGSYWMAIGIMGAIIERNKHPEKKGQYIDVSILDSSFASNPWDASLNISPDPLNLDLLHGEYPNYAIYRTEDDKYLAVGNIEPKFWERFCNILGLEKYISKLFTPLKKRKEIYDIVQMKLLTRTQDEWMAIFLKEDLCVTPVNSYKEAIENPQLGSRDMVKISHHPDFGDYKVIGNPIKYSRTILSKNEPAVNVGENTLSLLTELGYSKSEIAKLNTLGCFGKHF